MMTFTDLQYCIYCNQKVMLYILKAKVNFSASITLLQTMQKNILDKAISIFKNQP